MRRAHSLLKVCQFPADAAPAAFSASRTRAGVMGSCSNLAPTAS